MTVHRVRLYHSTDGAQSYHDWLGQWLNNVDAALQSEIDNEPPTIEQTEDEKQEWYSGNLAFEWDEGKAHILDNIDQYAAAYCNWHRIGYHECSHDEENLTPCSWDEQRENGTVPDDIPDMSPES